MKRKILGVIKIIYKIALILFTSFMVLGLALPSASYIPYQDRIIVKIEILGIIILIVPLLFFIGSMFGCFKKIKIMSDKRFKVKLIIAAISMLTCFGLIGILFSITSNNYSEEYVQILEQRKLEAQNKKLAKQEEKKKQEELAKQEEKKKQEELVKQEEEKKKQEELAKQEEEKKKQEELAKQEEEKKKQEELVKQEEEKKRQDELAKKEEEKKKQDELAKQEEEKKKQEELAKQEEIKNEESTGNNSEFKSATGNLYTGVTLYAEENGQMEPYFTVLDRGENVRNPGASVIKNGVLVKEIHSGDTYWKDVDKMIKDSFSNEQYIIKYYVKKDDPYLP